MQPRGLLRRHVALPSEHGSWGFFLSPLLIGLFAGGEWRTTSFYLVAAVLCAFLARHPLTLIIKVQAGRMPRETLAAAWAWFAAYSAVAVLQVVGLVLRGYGYVLWLAVPALPVLLWHLVLVSRRGERRQWLMEVAAAGALALSAPAAAWVGWGRVEAAGWWLWGLTWAQSAAAILTAYMRLGQRALSPAAATGERLRLGRAALLATSCNLAAVAACGVLGVLPRWLFVPYALQWAEVLRGLARPAIGVKPAAIGYRQLGVHALFTLLFAVLWRLSRAQ
jgi:hypothetical protein